MAKTKTTTFDYLKGMKFATEDDSKPQEKVSGRPVVPHEVEEEEEEEQKVKVGYMIPASLLEFIKRCAFWEREDDTTILVKALTEYAKGKNYDPIPPDKIKKKRGAKPKR